ncbi:MAG TPA: aconitate hydratase [Rheinheimera sp.]|uniref:AMP-binding protein n=1 Tax=Rheinheimera sp. TaxID=1869214 RepID=UPI000EEDB01D|nr:AMP-binding protein [Rheinheimera sp.]HCU64204.1 aconitate hydratase [Rheinheimera sp.]
MAEFWHFAWPSFAEPLFLAGDADLTDKADAMHPGQVTVTAGDFLLLLQQATQLALQLPGQRVMLYQPDSYLFVVSLFALLQAGKTVLLAPNGLPDTLAQAAVFTDVQLAEDWLADAAQSGGSLVSSVAGCRLPLDGELVFFTSGSSGAPKLVSKKLWQLQREIAVLSQTFAQFGATTTPLVAATVPPQHIYGLLFRLLWPLSRGWTLARGTVHFAGQWLALCRYQQPVMLISSPAHLCRYQDAAELLQQQPELRQQLLAVFSSGGPLASQDAARFYQQTGLAPLEIYGSTETGGIGWRQYQCEQPEPAWQAFATIGLRQDEQGCLELISPYLPDDNWFQTADLVSLESPQHFRLHGRADRIVKLAEKRLALGEVERCCAELPYVEQAVALVLPGRSATSRPQLALVVLLNQQGRQLLAQLGKLQLNQQIKQKLAARFETVLLPRRFSYPAQLPFNAQGKLPRQALELLFLS